MVLASREALCLSCQKSIRCVAKSQFAVALRWRSREVLGPGELVHTLRGSGCRVQGFGFRVYGEFSKLVGLMVRVRMRVDVVRVGVVPTCRGEGEREREGWRGEGADL